MPLTPRMDAELPDPGLAHTPEEFGRELTRARRRAGLTVRQVAKASGIPARTAGDYFTGRHLPPAGQPGQLLKILAACGISGSADTGRWLAALRAARRPPGRRAAQGTAPYRGLASPGSATPRPAGEPAPGPPRGRAPVSCAR
jgi:transcriptional regulator with XRE-family HTH domain